MEEWRIHRGSKDRDALIRRTLLVCSVFGQINFQMTSSAAAKIRSDSATSKSSRLTQPYQWLLLSTFLPLLY